MINIIDKYIILYLVIGVLFAIIEHIKTYYIMKKINKVKLRGELSIRWTTHGVSLITWILIYPIKILIILIRWLI